MPSNRSRLLRLDALELVGQRVGVGPAGELQPDLLACRRGAWRPAVVLDRRGISDSDRRGAACQLGALAARRRRLAANIGSIGAGDRRRRLAKPAAHRLGGDGIGVAASAGIGENAEIDRRRLLRRLAASAAAARNGATLAQLPASPHRSRPSRAMRIAGQRQDEGAAARAGGVAAWPCSGAASASAPALSPADRQAERKPAARLVAVATAQRGAIVGLRLGLAGPAGRRRGRGRRRSVATGAPSCCARAK